MVIKQKKNQPLSLSLGLRTRAALNHLEGTPISRPKAGRRVGFRRVDSHRPPFLTVRIIPNYNCSHTEPGARHRRRATPRTRDAHAFLPAGHSAVVARSYDKAYKPERCLRAPDSRLRHTHGLLRSPAPCPSPKTHLPWMISCRSIAT